VSESHDNQHARELVNVPDPAVVNDLYADPGLPEHQWRPTDVDEHAEKRAERQVATLFGLSAICTILFLVSYFVFDIGDDPDVVGGFGASNLFLGLSLAGALLFLGSGIIQWARKLMADHEIVEYRHPAASSDDDREATLAALNAGLEESGIGRRPLVRNSLLGAVGLLGLPAVVALRDLGPTPNQVKNSDAYPGAGIENTLWAKGVRVVRDVVGTPIRPGEVEIGDLFNAEPETLFNGGEDGEPLEGLALQVGKSKGAVVMIRMAPEEIIPGKGRENWSVDGIVCYSKICTHVGCPISLNERKTHHLLCPCHQSTFDLADSGRVIFGPAARALPQLPLAVDEEGYLIAQSDFTEPVGPSFWERG
jgi:ubiquinol-cytochrome c reductase iron-sulfur subunit